ncbi:MULTISPECIES: FecR family protein [Chitinophagaceae]
MEPLDTEHIIHIATLIRGYKDSTLTVQEQEALDAWRKLHVKNQELFERLSDNKYVGIRLLQLDDYPVQPHLDRIHQHLQTVKSIGRKKWHYWWAAASVLAITILAIAFWGRLPFAKHEDLITSRTKEQYIIHNATLTLPDGSRVELKDFKNGDTLVKGNLQIINRNGSFVYVDKKDGKPFVGDNTVSTPFGKQFELTLPDQTRVWLNGASTIRYPTRFDGNERKVQISGEVYFEVAKNKKLPFVVIANNQKVKVLGTHFNINSYMPDKGITTTLLEGSVDVTSLSDDKITARLVPGQQAQFVKGMAIRVRDNVDVNEILAWKRGMFVFNNASIEDILQTVSIWYNIKVEYRTKITDRYTLNINNSVSLLQLLDYLERSGGVHFKMENNVLIVND